MNANRRKTLILAGCPIVLLCGVMPQKVAAAAAADPVSGTEQVQPLQLAQQEFTSSKWPGEYATQSGDQKMIGPGSQSMMGQGMGPGSERMMGPGMGRPGQGMMRPGMGGPGQSMMGPSTGPGSRGMTGSGIQAMPEHGGQGTMGPGPGMGPGNHGIMGGPMGGSPMAMFNAIGTLDLTDEQRSKYDAINKDLNKRTQEIADRMNAESAKLRNLQEEQMRTGRTLNDLRGHMLQATMDAANRAEELLTDKQRQQMIDQGRHIMMQPPGLPYGGPKGGNIK